MELAGPRSRDAGDAGVTKTALMTHSPVIDAEHRESLQRAFDKAPGVLPRWSRRGRQSILKRKHGY